MLNVPVHGQFFCDAVKESIGILCGIILLLCDLVHTEDIGAVPKGRKKRNRDMNTAKGILGAHKAPQ